MPPKRFSDVSDAQDVSNRCKSLNTVEKFDCYRKLLATQTVTSRVYIHKKCIADTPVLLVSSALFLSSG